MPRKRDPRITARVNSVIEALREMGLRNAFTPFAIASIPVSAVQPEAKALSSSKKANEPSSGEAGAAGGVSRFPVK